MAKQSVLDRILDEIVVFRNPDGTYFSNNPAWNNDAVREAWSARQAGDLEDDAEDDGDEDELVAYTDMTNDDLRAELASRKLDVSGKKADMVARLEADDAASED